MEKRKAKRGRVASSVANQGEIGFRKRLQSLPPREGEVILPANWEVAAGKWGKVRRVTS